MAETPLEELIAAEQSSALEAVQILFQALGWNSGGLAAAAQEVCDQLTAAHQRLAQYEKGEVVAVPRRVVAALKDWSGAEPSTSVLQREVAIWLTASKEKP